MAAGIMERDVFLERAFPGERQIAMYPAQIPLNLNANGMVYKV